MPIGEGGWAGASVGKVLEAVAPKSRFMNMLTAGLTSGTVLA